MPLIQTALASSVIREQLRILGNGDPPKPETFERGQGLRRTAYDSEDSKEGRATFLEKREPVFTGKQPHRLGAARNAPPWPRPAAAGRAAAGPAPW